MFKHFKINIHKYPTIASLTFSIWRSNSLEDGKTNLAITDLRTYDLLRVGYTGGAVDVFRPTSAAPAELLIFYPAVAWQPPGMGRRSSQKLGETCYPRRNLRFGASNFLWAFGP